MPDHSFPAAKPPRGFHPVIKPFTGVGQPPSFPSLIEPRPAPWQASSLQNRQSDISSLLRPLTFYAEPLAPLRQSDAQALEDIFDDDQITDIVSDVCARLKKLYPEPCWEDEPFDFLINQKHHLPQ